MTLSNAVKKEEALKLRESGKKLTDIVTETGLSKATLKRLFRKTGVTKIKGEPIPNKDTVEGNHEGEPIKSELEDSKNEDSNVKRVIESEPKEKVKFTGGAKSVTYDSRTGSIIISESAEKVPYIPRDDTSDKCDAAQRTKRATAGGGQQYQRHVESRKRDIDEPENAIDDLFSRKIVSTLIPLGLILSGYLMEGDKSNMPLQPINAGENIRKRVQGWLGEGGNNDNW